MSKITLYDINGKAVGDIEMDDRIFAVRCDPQTVKDIVVNVLARKRAGTASTLNKGEVAGSNKKPWRQKGTGRARVGFRQSPVWRGGGVVFGPKPRKYGGRINKKATKLAFARVFGDKVTEGNVAAIECFDIKEPKTKNLCGFVKSIGGGKKILLVDEKPSQNLLLACRNIEGVDVEMACNLNVYQMVRYPKIVMSRSAVEAIKKRLNEIVEKAV